MRPEGFIEATFSFTPSALAMIEKLRIDAEREGQALGAVGFAWGHVQLNDGSKHEQPMIGFYLRSQMDSVARASIQNVDGVDLIVFSTPDQAKNFDRRTIDFADGKGFFVVNG